MDFAVFSKWKRLNYIICVRLDPARPRATSAWYNTCGDISVGHSRVMPRGAQRPQFLDIVPTWYESNSNRILRADQNRWEENFYAVDHAPSPCRGLTSDLFAVANFPVLTRSWGFGAKCLTRAAWLLYEVRTCELYCRLIIIIIMHHFRLFIKLAYAT